MTVHDFIADFIDGYLASDLDTMSKANRADGLMYGDVGYPMVLTTLAGIELLGGLLLPMTTPVKRKNGRNRFLRFWDDYLAKDFSVYCGFGDLFYGLLRNGVAHTYTAKQGVYVTKGSGAPLQYDAANHQVTIDSNVFAQDFLSVYRKNVLPLLSIKDGAGPNSMSMQTHLDELMKLYEEDSEDEFKKLKPSQESLENASRASGAVVAFSPIAGVSGPLGDPSAKPFTTPSGLRTPNL